MFPRLLLSLAAISAFGAAFAAPEPAVPPNVAATQTLIYGAPLHCPSERSSSILQSAAPFGKTPGTEAWVLNTMKGAGVGSTIPKDHRAYAAALTVAGLLRAGDVVAAKMGAEEADATIPSYKASKFSSTFRFTMTALTQPVMHPSYPSSVRADGEAVPGENGIKQGAHTHGIDLETASASLYEIIRRAELAKRAVGPEYNTKPAIRYYLLANGFKDFVALQAASALVCALKPDATLMNKIDVSARLMAMPSENHATDVAAGVPQ